MSAASAAPQDDWKPAPPTSPPNTGSRRRCLLVSKPIDTIHPPSQLPEWTAIGNSAAVPNLKQTMPIGEHWALCVLPCCDIVDPSDPYSRQLFLHASYFDLGVLSSNQSWFRLFSKSHSYDAVIPTQYPEGSVRTISSFLDIGVTGRTDAWLSERSKDDPGVPS
jgi:hypothetical protein